MKSRLLTWAGAVLIGAVAGWYVFSGDISDPSTSQAAGGGSETPRVSKELLGVLEGRWVEINGGDAAHASVLWFHLCNKDGRFDAKNNKFGNYQELNQDHNQFAGDIIRLEGSEIEAVRMMGQTVTYRYHKGRLQRVSDGAIFERP